MCKKEKSIPVCYVKGDLPWRVSACGVQLVEIPRTKGRARRWSIKSQSSSYLCLSSFITLLFFWGCPSVFYYRKVPDELPYSQVSVLSYLQGPPQTEAKHLCILVQGLREPVWLAQFMGLMSTCPNRQTAPPKPNAFISLWKRGELRAEQVPAMDFRSYSIATMILSGCQG